MVAECVLCDSQYEHPHFVVYLAFLSVANHTKV